MQSFLSPVIEPDVIRFIETTVAEANTGGGVSLRLVAVEIGTRFPADLIRLGLTDRGRAYEVTLHNPADDGASGPQGHLGLCIGRIVF